MESICTQMTLTKLKDADKVEKQCNDKTLHQIKLNRIQFNYIKSN